MEHFVQQSRKRVRYGLNSEHYSGQSNLPPYGKLQGGVLLYDLVQNFNSPIGQVENRSRSKSRDSDWSLTSFLYCVVLTKINTPPSIWAYVNRVLDYLSLTLPVLLHSYSDSVLFFGRSKHHMDH